MNTYRRRSACKLVTNTTTGIRRTSDGDEFSLRSIELLALEILPSKKEKLDLYLRTVHYDDSIREFLLELR